MAGLLVSSPVAVAVADAPGSMKRFDIPGDPQTPPEGLAARPTGGVEFVAGDGRLGSVSTTGALAYSSPRFSAAPGELSYGSDRSLWVGLANGNLARIAPSGSVTEYPAGVPPFGYAQFGAGPDGSMWFTRDATSIGHIDAMGGTRNIALDDVGSMVPYDTQSVVVSDYPGGYRAPFDDNRVARVWSNGRVKQLFSLGSALPYFLAMDARKNIWFTVLNPQDKTHRGSVARFDGVRVRDFGSRLPKAASPGAITLGSDGNLWFTLGYIKDPTVARITPAGKLTFFPIRDSEGGFWIVGGRDGFVWVLQNDFDNPASVIRIATGYPRVAARAALVRRNGKPGGVSLRLRCVGLAGTCHLRISIAALALTSTAPPLGAGKVRTITFRRSLKKAGRTVRIAVASQNNRVVRAVPIRR